MTIADRPTSAAPPIAVDDEVSVLFVDDDAMLLQGLRRMLHPMRREWNMTFAGSGKEALSHMEKEPVDVVVSDMRMPEMDGAELLCKVGEINPAAIRIVLSGFAENEAVMKTVGPSHQYLAKPCDADHLIQTIKRSLDLRHRLGDPRIKAFVAELGSLPALPHVYHDFMAAIADPTATIDTIASVIERDIGLAATVLKLTNSAYFCLPTKITDCRQAVRLLGLDTMRSLVASACVFRSYEGSPRVRDRLQSLCDKAMATAASARRIAMENNLSPHQVEQACCAGLLSHVGILMLLAEHPDCCSKAEEIVAREGISPLEAERRAIGANHAEAGAYLLSLWGFSDPVIEAVLHHHDPDQECPDAIDDALGAVRAAHTEVTAGNEGACAACIVKPPKNDPLASAS